ncbi:MAG: kelch repeat-containing protein [Dokdonella sp.]
MNKLMVLVLGLASLTGVAHANGSTAGEAGYGELIGESPSGVAVDDIFCAGFDRVSNGSCERVPSAWTLAAVGPPARYRAGSASDGTNVYVFGGGSSTVLNDLWRWNAATQVWTQLAIMPTAKQNIQGTFLNGKIYVPGGYTGSTHIAENAIYDVASNTWSLGAPLPVIHTGATAAYNGKIYVFGGNPGPLVRLDIYDPVANSWAQGANMPTATTYGRAVTAGSYIYYVGGIAGTTTAAVYRYDPANNTYALMAPLNTARATAEVMSLGNHIYAINGGDSTFFTGVPLAQSVEIYNIATNSWAYGLPTVTKSAASSGGRAGGKLMIMGGVDATTYYDQVQVSPLVLE